MTSADGKVPIKPRDDRVLVRPPDRDHNAPSGQVIQGLVVAVGPGRVENGKRVKLDVTVGDVVLYDASNATDVRFGGEAYLVLSAPDIIATVAR